MAALRIQDFAEEAVDGIFEFKPEAKPTAQEAVQWPIKGMRSGTRNVCNVLYETTFVQAFPDDAAMEAFRQTLRRDYLVAVEHYKNENFQAYWAALKALPIAHHAATARRQEYANRAIHDEQGGGTQPETTETACDQIDAVDQRSGCVCPFNRGAGAQPRCNAVLRTKRHLGLQRGLTRLELCCRSLCAPDVNILGMQRRHLKPQHATKAPCTAVSSARLPSTTRHRPARDHHHAWRLHAAC